jgi:hypothetical protein
LNKLNISKAGVSAGVMDAIARQLQDPAEVSRSRQLPMRFLSAHRATLGDPQWELAIGRALDHSLANVPASFVLPRQSITVVDPEFKTQSAWLSNVQVERALTSNIAVSAGYVNSIGRNLPVLLDANLIPSGATLPDGRKKKLGQDCDSCHTGLAFDEDPAKFDDTLASMMPGAN